MKIYGNPMSTCSRKVLTTLGETTTPFEFVVIDLAKGEHKQPAHLARQPFGQVPALEDDGFWLYESRAMCRYINEKANGPLIPKDLKERATMEQWISVETSNFTGASMKFIQHHVFQRPQDAATLETATKSLDQALTIMEAQLAKAPFIAAKTFTLADICFMPYIGYMMGTPAKSMFAKYAHVTAWWNKCSERPSWKKVTA